MKTAYYARPINIYGSKQDQRDIATITRCGFDPVDITAEDIQEKYASEGMSCFLEVVRGCDILFFRALPDGSIPAGVAKEIDEAQCQGIPVVELPSAISRRYLNVEQTRVYLQEVGFR